MSACYFVQTLLAKIEIYGVGEVWHLKIKLPFMIHT